MTAPASSNVPDKKEQWKRECQKKRRYTLDEALDVIVRAKQQEISLQKYPCNYCGHWHLTANMGLREVF